MQGSNPLKIKINANAQSIIFGLLKSMNVVRIVQEYSLSIKQKNPPSDHVHAFETSIGMNCKSSAKSTVLKSIIPILTVCLILLYANVVTPSIGKKHNSCAELIATRSGVRIKELMMWPAVAMAIKFLTLSNFRVMLHLLRPCLEVSGLS